MTASEGFRREHCLGATAAPHYRHWQFTLVAPHLGESVVEVGSGVGHFSAQLAAHRPRRLVLTDDDAPSLAALRERYAGTPGIEVRPLTLPGRPDLGEPVDSVVAINVLEHIPDDIGALRDLSAAVRPGGRLVLWVPAHERLYGEFDRKVGHVRRYDRRSLTAAVEAAGLRIREIHAVNALGAVAWWWAVHKRSVTFPRPALVWPYDNVLIPVAHALEKLVTPPFGQSMFCVAEVPQ